MIALEGKETTMKLGASTAMRWGDVAFGIYTAQGDLAVGAWEREGDSRNAQA